jgi:hopanoid biosynthesis associated RND transporter like protein HpnN
MRMERERDEETALLPRLLVRLVDGVCRHPRLVLTAALTVCALSIYLSWTRLEFRTQRSDLISPNKDFQKRWLAYVKEFGDDDDMVVVVQGGDRARMEQALEALAAEVKQKPTLFDRLFYKVDLRPLHNRALLFLPVDEIRRIQANLTNMSLLLEPPTIAGDPLIGWKNLSLVQFLAEAQRRVGTVPAGKTLSSADEPFFTQLASISRTAAAYLKHPGRYGNPWQSILQQPAEQKDLLAEPQYFFSGDGQLAFLLVRPTKDQSSFTCAKESVEALRHVLARFRAKFTQLQFGLTGLPVLENDEMVASQRDTELASWLALAAVAVLYLIVFRGVRYPLLTVSTLLVGIAWALGWLTLTVGHLNILSATFAIMLIAMGDYGVLWVTRYEQARRCGMDVPEALRHTARHVAVGNLTAAMALALAFFAAMFADFAAVAELGWIAGCGVLLCALACFTVLPAVLTLADRRQMGVVSIPITTSAGWLPRLSARPRLVIGTALVVAALLAVFITRLRYDHNLLHMQDPGLDAVRWEQTLIAHTDGASWHALSYTDTPEEALALKARYEQLPEVSRVVEAASLVPPGQGSKLELLRDIQRRLRHLPPRGALIPHQPPNVAQLRESVGKVLLALSTCGDSPGRSRLVAGLKELQSGLAGQGGGPAERRLQSFEELMARDLADDLHRLRDVSTPKSIELADLPGPLRERYVGRSGKWLLRVFARDCLWEFGPLEHFTQRIRTVDPEATGKPFGTVEGLRALKDGFQWAGLYALVVIVLVLLGDFRSVPLALVAVTPLAVGLLLSLGVMGLCGLPLNPANIIALPLILGVGIDNGVHVLHDYLLRRAGGRVTISRAIGRGVLVKALTTMIGFATLMVSSHRGLFGLGFILTLGVCCCMLTALVLLPALLRVLSNRKQSANEARENLRLERARAAA